LHSIGFIIIAAIDASTSSCCWVDIYRFPKEIWLKELDPVFQLLAVAALSSSGDRVSSSLINPVQVPALGFNVLKFYLLLHICIYKL